MKEETLFGTNSSVLPWGQTSLQLGSSALVQHLQCVGTAEKTQSSVTAKVCSPARRELAYIDRSPRPVLMKMGTKPSQFGPKGSVQIGQNRTTLIGQSHTALIGWGKPQCYQLQQDSRNSSINSGSDGRSIVQASSSAQMQTEQCSLSVRCSLRNKALGRNVC